MAGRKSESGLGASVLANFVGSAWSTIVAIVFVPFYLKHLGAEGYGIVGFSTTLLSIVAFLDGGLTLTVNRELARLSDAPSNATPIQETLSAGGILFAIIAASVTVVVWLGAPWIATRWLNANHLGVDEIVISIRLIGFVLGEQMLLALTQGALFGLHRQTTVNLVLIGASTVRAVGAALILKYVSATPSAFFAWYAFTLLAQICILYILLVVFIGAATPFAWPRASVIKTLLLQTRGFGAIALLSLALSQIDKIVVSRLLPLQDFGYYMVAMSVSLAPLMIVGPFTSAIFPRLARLSASKTQGAFDLFYRGTQMVTALIMPVGFTFSLFAREIVFAWTGNATVTSHVAPILSILVVAYSINASLQMPYYFEMAHARTRMNVIISAVALVLVVPTMVVLTARFGAVGAASCWLLLNIGILFVGAPLVLRKALETELWRYYTVRLLPSYAFAALVVGLARYLTPYGLPRIVGGALSVAVMMVAIAACFLAIPALRALLIRRGRILYATVHRPS
jgi:O-antigen/teichoic acid export membrane protein